MKIALLAVLSLACLAPAQHTWQKPPSLRSRAALEKIMGPAVPSESRLSRDLKVVLVWGYDNDRHSPTAKTHPAGCHEYGKFKDLWASLLAKVPRVQVDTAFYFPTARQWETADLVVFYLHLDFLVDSHYVHIDRFQARGGGILALHETAIQRPTGTAWASRIGMAWNDAASKWGHLPSGVTVPKNLVHPIFQGFPDTVAFVDEFYWNLTQGNAADFQVLATSPGGPPGVSTAPARPDQLDGKAWPLFWTYRKGPGKVFATTVGHNHWTYQDPYFRLILFRATAWVLDESFEPFRPLITEGVQLVEDKPSGIPLRGRAPLPARASAFDAAGKPARPGNPGRSIRFPGR